MNNNKPVKLKSALTMSLLSIVILTMVTSLNGCDEATFKYVCPSLKKYSREFQDKLAGEYTTLPSASKQVITDYLQLRDACRALERKA